MLSCIRGSVGRGGGENKGGPAGNEPGPIALEATMLNFTPPTLLICNCNDKKVVPCNRRYNDVIKSIQTLTIIYMYATFPTLPTWHIVVMTNVCIPELSTEQICKANLAHLSCFHGNARKPYI